MAYLTSISTSTLSNQNISSALLVHTFTNTTRIRKIYINVYVDQIAGNGDYYFYCTVQRAGAGSHHEFGARTKVAVPNGTTAQGCPTIALVVDAAAVVKVYVIGLAGDTTTPDIITDISEEWIDIDASGRVNLGSILGTALTETVAGYLAVGFKKLHDVAVPVFTLASVNQSGDAYASIASIFSGITSLANWLRGLARKDAMNATAKTELNSGGGTYNEATDAMEAQLDSRPGAAPTVGDIDTQLSGTHGAGAWGPAGASGAYTIAVTIRNATTLVGVPYAQVTVKGSGDTSIVDQQDCDANGQHSFSLNAATYKVHVAAVPGYASLAAQTLVVSANASVTYDLTPIPVGTPSAPNLCRVYGYEYLNGVAVQNSAVTATLINLPRTTTTVILEGTIKSTLSDSNGYWYVDLVRNEKYAIHINAAGIDKTITVPDSASVDLRTLL